MQSSEHRTFGQTLKTWLPYFFLMVLGVASFIWGLTFMVAVIPDYLLGFALILVGIALCVPLFLKTHNEGKAIIRRAQLLEEEELKRIKKTMTPAEWELYKVQRENQKLLKQMNAKPAQSSGPKPIFGITNDLSD